MGVGDSVRALKQVAKGEMLVGMDAPWIGLNLASMCILSTDASLATRGGPFCMSYTRVAGCLTSQFVL